MRCAGPTRFYSLAGNRSALRGSHPAHPWRRVHRRSAGLRQWRKV